MLVWQNWHEPRFGFSRERSDPPDRSPSRRRKPVCRLGSLSTKMDFEIGRFDRMRQIQNKIEQADQADFIARLPEDFAKRKIYPRADAYFL